MAVCVACGAQVQKVTRDGLCVGCAREVLKRQAIPAGDVAPGEKALDRAAERITRSVERLQKVVERQARDVRRLSLLFSVFFYVWAGTLVFWAVFLLVNWQALKRLLRFD